MDHVVRQDDDQPILDIEGTITDTYFWLRWGTGMIAIVFPILLYAGGKLVHGKGLQPSMSAYYGTDMHDWFVGLLFATAAGLYLYEGLTDLENHFMTGAAICAVGVAINPMGWHPPWWATTLTTYNVTPHGIFAILFFTMILLSCWFCRGDSLRLKILSPRRTDYYNRQYSLIGALLVIAPLAAVLLNMGLIDSKGTSSAFIAEWFAIWTYAWYWFTKTEEIQAALDAAKTKRTNPQPIPTR